VKWLKSRNRSWSLVDRGLRVNRSETLGESHFEDFSEDLNFLKPEESK
jgi:hypothetical protein